MAIDTEQVYELVSQYRDELNEYKERARVWRHIKDFEPIKPDQPTTLEDWNVYHAAYQSWRELLDGAEQIKKESYDITLVLKIQIRDALVNHSALGVWFKHPEGFQFVVKVELGGIIIKVENGESTAENEDQC